MYRVEVMFVHEICFWCDIPDRTYALYGNLSLSDDPQRVRAGLMRLPDSGLPWTMHGSKINSAPWCGSSGIDRFTTTIQSGVVSMAKNHIKCFDLLLIHVTVIFGTPIFQHFPLITSVHDDNFNLAWKVECMCLLDLDRVFKWISSK